MKRGFTLIEMLVATLLLGMLVTVLTMIFNASSIAWRTGTAGVALLGDTRRQLGTFHDIRDEILPGVGDGKNAQYGTARAINKRTVSVFQKGSNKLRTDRTFDTVNWNSAPQFDLSGAAKGGQYQLKGGKTAGSGLFTVGVRSAGPNRKFGDDDDITTWPDEVF